LYRERDEEKRKKFVEEISKIDESKIFWVDESGINEHLIREHGRAPRGEKVYGERSGKKFDRHSVVSALNLGKFVAPFGYKGTCDTVLFETWVEKVLLPELFPDSVVILDNATFHKSEKTRKLIENAGCRLIFLPPYSPDLNPIEHLWDWMKNKIRDTCHLFANLEFAIMAAVNQRRI
jgi:transposase